MSSALRPLKPSPERTNLHRLQLDLPPELGDNLGQARWERIFEAVEAEILNSIPFGTFQISESLIGEHFDVSRTVVRDVLSRLDARGLIVKDRTSHWIAGPLSARMLDDAHEIRRLIEPGALCLCDGRYSPKGFLSEGRSHRCLRAGPIGGAFGRRGRRDRTGNFMSTRWMRSATGASPEPCGFSRFRWSSTGCSPTYIGLHDEIEMLREHALVYDHMLLGDADGTSAAMRHHLDADHARSRARLKVLSVFDAAEIAPYLIRIH